MLYLGYTFEATEYAHGHLDVFWRWMEKREPWFYQDLEMVRCTMWHVETRDSALHIHHYVEFDDEQELAEYRTAIAEKSADPSWEERRLQQNVWYRIIARSIYYSPPVALGFQGRG